MARPVSTISERELQRRLNSPTTAQRDAGRHRVTASETRITQQQVAERGVQQDLRAASSVRDWRVWMKRTRTTGLDSRAQGGASDHPGHPPHPRSDGGAHHGQGRRDFTRKRPPHLAGQRHEAPPGGGQAFQRPAIVLIGLYLHPPERIAVTRRVSAKPWNGPNRGCLLGMGRVRTRTHDYKRHGTITLFGTIWTAS